MSITVNKNGIGPVELASSSFGQTNKLTPIQMITAASAIVNGGNLLTPQVVNSITDENGNIIKKSEVVKKRQVISKKTSDEMKQILEGVVKGEKGSNCYIQGYRIGGKSGTSQKLDENVAGTTYVASYCAFAPADDPQVIMLVLVDEPTGEKYYGSQVASPVCVQVMTEMLPYLEIFPQYTEEERKTLQVSVPNVQTYTVESAKQTLENLSLKVTIVGNGKNVVRQYPTGVSIENGGTVVLCTDDTKPQTVTVPNLMGLTRQQAKELLSGYGLNLTAQGSGASEKDAVAQGDQQAIAGRKVPVGTSISVTFTSRTVHSQ
jgi:stage V sporulation protein D (sporulation-specific penicillin-binding protein)